MPCQYIYIYKGDDTNWNNEQFVTINVTPAEGSEIDLTDMKAKFILGSYSQEYNLTTGSFTVDLSAAVTDVYAFGPINGIVRVYDTQNRVKTITNTIPFYITDQVISEQHQSIDLEVPEGSTVDINVTVGGQVSYNDLTDKPSINGVTVEGDKSGYDYGLADAAGLALKVSKSGDTMTGNLVMGQGTQITMADGALKSDDGMLGLEGQDYWLRVDTTIGLGAAIKSTKGIGNVLTTLDVKSTYSANGSDPVNGQAVAQAISGKQDTITGGATTITQDNLTANKALISSNNGKVAVSNVTSTELGYVSGVTSAIQTQINNEVQARTNADNDLQGQIDAISAASDVTDIVGTYAELEAYDTQHLKDNDIIKVLTDSTHDNASTYYRWSTHTQTFTYIGAEGPYYTKSEADAEFLSQADAATTYLTQANAASTYATQTALTNGLATKASSADGVTITDSGSAISTVAVKEQRANTAIKQWVGTKAQYEAIDTKDANTVYIITDETDVEAITVDSALSTTSEHPVQNKVVTAALNTKQSTLTAGTGISISSNVISTDALRNTATGTDSLTIDGDPTTYQRAINIGQGSQARAYATRVGYGGYANGNYSTSLGYSATTTTTANNSIQIGAGTTSSANEMNVGFYGGSNYKLLDGTTGKIPIERLPDGIGGAPTLTWYTGNTGTTVTIADTTGATLVKIYKNGLLLQPTEDYSISGTTLTLVTALVSTDKITLEVF